jgi:hypothetical protein
MVADAGVAELGVGLDAPGLDTPTSAGLGDCFEHALTANSRPRIAKPAIIASFCWRDQDDSVVPEIVLLIARFALFWLVDFPIVAILSPPLRLAQSKVIWQESDQHGGR